MRTFIITTCVLVAAAIGVGFWMNWFSMDVDNRQSSENSEVSVKLSVNEGKMNEDLEQAKQSAKETTQNASEGISQAAQATVDGAKKLADKTGEELSEAAERVTGADHVVATVQGVDAEKKELTVQTKEGKSLKLSVNDDSTFRGEKVEKFDDIKNGDQVEITYRTDEGVHFIQTLAVHNDSKES